MEAPPSPLSSRAKPRDLQFRGPFLEMFFRQSAAPPSLLVLILAQDSHAGAGADARSARLQHGARIVQRANAAGSFHPAAIPGNAAQDRHVGRR